jgi:hypothetical protein
MHTGGFTTASQVPAYIHAVAVAPSYERRHTEGHFVAVTGLTGVELNPVFKSTFHRVESRCLGEEQQRWRALKPVGNNPVQTCSYSDLTRSSTHVQIRVGGTCGDKLAGFDRAAYSRGL